jgi:hypothetical protein
LNSLAVKPKPRKMVMLVRPPAAVDVASLPLEAAPPHEVRRRILAGEEAIFAKAFSDLREGKISARDVIRMEIQINALKAVERASTASAGANRA